MIDGERGEAMEGLESRDDILCQRAIKVERQGLNLGAVTQKLNQGVGDGHRSSASGCGGGKSGVMFGLCGDGEFSNVVMV